MTSIVRVTLPLTVLTLCCCVAFTLAFDGLWFGSMPDVVETTTPYPVEVKTSRVSSVNAKRRPSSTSSSIKSGNVTLTKHRVASIRRRVNASSPSSSPSQRVKIVNADRGTSPQPNRTVSPSQGAKMEEVTYWETDSVGGSESSHSNQTSEEVSVKEHDRSPHPASFPGGGGSGGESWFGRFKGPSSSSADQAAAVSVAGYQSSGEPEATVQIKEHDELGVGAGAHFSFPSGGDESALWFGGGSSNAGNAKPETSSTSSSSSGGSDSGAWFGLDNWAPLSLDSSVNHRQQRRLRTPEVEKADDIITAAPPSSRDTFSFVVNSNLGGGGDGDETTIKPTWDFEEEAIITAEPSVVEDSWFEDEEETTSVTPSSTTTTTTTTTPMKPIVVTKSKTNNSYIVGISKVSRVNEQRSIIDFIDEDEEIVNVSQNYITMPLTTSTPVPTTSETVTRSQTEETTIVVTENEAKSTTESSIILSELELFLALENKTTNIMKTNYTTAKPVENAATNESLTMREGREFNNANYFGSINVNDNSEKINLTKSAVMTSSNLPKVLKSGPLASNSQVTLDNRDNTAYIIVGTCCAVSLLCLVVVVVILRYRKSVRRRRRQNPFHHYPMDRDPRFFHFEPHSTSWVDQQQPPNAILQGHKNLPPPPHHHHHPFNSPPSAAAHSKTRNLWFIGQKRSAPYSLCEPHHETGAAVTSPPPSYRANSHSSGS